MSSALEFILNGKPVRAIDVSPNTTLLEFLRARGLTGSKEGCAEGDCGACSVAIIERDAQGQAAYRAVNSCLMPVCLLAGREVVSVEGVGCAAKMHPVQRTMAEGYGSQCGYCTPGFTCSMFEGYYREDLRTQDDLDDQLSGNLCRCTGYRPIREAAIAAWGERAKAKGKDTFAARLKKADPVPGEASYEFAGEKFFRPTSLEELFRLRKEHPEARLIAGATELGLDITKRYKKFPTLISLEGVTELKQIERTRDEWQIGAAVTLTEIEDRLGEEFPVLGDMLRVFGSRQIRNRATMGGNIVTASPIGDCAPVLLALGAKVVLVDGEKIDRPRPQRSGRRDDSPRWLQTRCAISEFFVSYRKTAMLPEDVLKAIIIPRSGAAAGRTRKSAWFKVSKRREMDISTVAACFVVDVDARNIIRHARLAFGGVAAMPVRAKETEAALLGKGWSEKTIQKVLPILRKEFAPISDVRGTAEYRSGLIASLLEKFFADTSEGRVTRVP